MRRKRVEGFAVDAWSEQGWPRKRQLEDRSLAEATAVYIGRECPGEQGLCRAPLAPGREWCPACTGTVELYWPSVSLKDEARTADAPGVPKACARPVPEAGEMCRWASGRPVLAASDQLQARIICAPPRSVRVTAGCAARRWGHAGLTVPSAGPSPPPRAPADRELELCRGGGGECRRLVCPAAACASSAGKPGKATRVAPSPVTAGPRDRRRGYSSVIQATSRPSCLARRRIVVSRRDASTVI